MKTKILPDLKKSLEILRCLLDVRIRGVVCEMQAEVKNRCCRLTGVLQPFLPLEREIIIVTIASPCEFVTISDGVFSLLCGGLRCAMLGLR